jgi:Fe-S cluster biogenesis protein NfuA
VLDTREAVERTLARVRPFLKADGGDVALVDVEGDDVAIRLSGACARCAQAELTLHFGIEEALRVRLPHVRVRCVE